MSDYHTKDQNKQIMHSLRELLVGETINDIKFPNFEQYGDLDDIKICTLSGKVIKLSPSAEFDRCGDYDGTRLYIEIYDEQNNMIFDDYLE